MAIAAIKLYHCLRRRYFSRICSFRFSMSLIRSLNRALSCRMRPKTSGFTLSLLSFTLSLSVFASRPETSVPKSTICFLKAPNSPCSAFLSRSCSSLTLASSSFSAFTSSEGAAACSMESLLSSCSMVTRLGCAAGISLCGLTTTGSCFLRSGTLMSRREVETESGGESMQRWERGRWRWGSGERFLVKYSLMNWGECSPESWDSLRRSLLAWAKGSQMISSRDLLDLLSGLLMAPTDFHILLQLSPHNSLLSLIIMSSSKYAGDDELTSATPVDPYLQQPILQAVSSNRREILEEEASNFHRLASAFAQRPFFSEDHYYLVSSRWLRRWKQYVSYEEVIAGKEPQKFFGCGTLPILNEDIVQSTDAFTLTFEGKHSYLNVKLKAGLMENRDYEFVDADTWAVLEEYDRKTVKRWVVKGKEGNKVELYLQAVSVIPLSMGILKDIENEKCTKLNEVTFQCSHYLTSKEVGSLVEGLLGEWARRSSYSSFPSDDFCRFWVLKETRKNVLWNTLHQGCKANASFSYKLFMDGELVNDDQEVGDLELLPETIVVAELREYRDNWTFYNLTHKLEASCSYCKKTGELGFVCSCKSAAYCSKQCKSYDKSTHRYRCPNDAESDEEDKPLGLTQNSRRGLAGLRNLGNTCFMNSGLQCLSHVIALTDFFLSDRYLVDINKTNKLGTQGELSAEYAKMVKNLWFGEQSSFSPTHLKKSIAKFQPMFSGYNQHDSGELITYLLDGLHEDLNRVIDKPYTETKDYDGRPDHVIAQQAWEIFLKRNQSIVVDLMYGQFKSIVQCPNESCGHVSVTFDPFSVCSLPILNTASKNLEITFIKDQVYTRKLNLSYSLEKSPTLEDLLPDLRSKVGVAQDTSLLIYVGSYSSCEVVDVKQQADKIRKEYKYRTMYVRELYPQQDPSTGIKLMLGNVINNDYYPDESYRKNIIPFHLFYTSPTSTNKQLYRQLTSYYHRILRAGKLSEEDYEKNYIDIDPADETFRLLMIPTSRYYTCGYCDKKSCSGCKLPYNDELFSKYIRYNPKLEYDRDRRIEMELYWRKDSKEVEKVFEEIKQEESSSFPTQAKSANASIYDCLNLFEREEVLNEDNAWYCPKCQDFVLARKQMKIYKAPKILILCLKRFKRKDYYSEKINLLIDCPVNGLDLTSCVANPQLPEEYFAQTRMIAQGEEDKVLYDLIGISNHFGSTGGGHYTAYCKDPNSREWYDFDDSSVNKLRGEEDVVTESAYILFYQRRM